MSKRRVIIAIAISLTLAFGILTLAFGIPLNAQHRRKRTVDSGSNVDREQMQKTRQTKDPNVQYLSGEAKVMVKGEEHPVIRIGCRSRNRPHSRPIITWCCAPERIW
jgi:hypothetical protein